MFTKLKTSLLLLLSTTALVSVGFSSWIINLSDSSVGEGATAVDNVIDNPYISFDTSKGTNNTGIDYLEYYYSGFKPEVGQITAYLILNLKNCRSNFQDTNSLEFKTNLFYYSDNLSSFNIFKDCGIGVSIKLETETTNSFKIERQVDYSKYAILPAIIFFPDILINIKSDIFLFSITYKFEFNKSTKIDNFGNDIFPFLSNSKFAFEIGLKEGVIK